MSTAMRTPQKVQSLRTHEIDAGDKTAGSQSHLARAVSMHLAGKREDALKQLQRAIAANEGGAEIYRAMGHIQFELEQYDDAIKTYEKLLGAAPQHPTANFNLGICFEKLNRWQDASDAFQKALQVDPQREEANLGWGICLLRQEKSWASSRYRGRERRSSSWTRRIIA